MVVIFCIRKKFKKIVCKRFQVCYQIIIIDAVWFAFLQMTLFIGQLCSWRCYLWIAGKDFEPKDTHTSQYQTKLVKQRVLNCLDILHNYTYILCKCFEFSKLHCSEIISYIGLKFSEIGHYTVRFQWYSVLISWLIGHKMLGLWASEAKKCKQRLAHCWFSNNFMAVGVPVYWVLFTWKLSLL